MIKRLILILTLLFTAGLTLKAQSFEQISVALKAGDASQLAQWFEKTIEFEEGTFSKAQAEQVLKKFFSVNKPLSFKLMHEGSSGKGAQYAIGTLKTDKGDYRTYILLKKVNGKVHIQQLKLSED